MKASQTHHSSLLLSQQQSDKEVYIDLLQELSLLKEWGHIQKHLLEYVLFASPNSTSSWCSIIEMGICHLTQGQARIWWEPVTGECARDNGHIIEIRYQNVRYGILKLAPGYLTSQNVSDIPQAFANLCAFLIVLTEHKVVVQSLLKTLQPLHVSGSLTSRERDVLQGMIMGENEQATANRLSIASTTVRTHRHHMYRSLDVHSPHEAVLRSFALRLLNWLDLPCVTERVETKHPRS